MHKNIYMVLLIQLIISAALIAQSGKNVAQKVDSTIALSEQQIKELLALRKDGTKGVAAISLSLTTLVMKSNENALSDKPDTLLSNKLSLEMSKTLSDLLLSVSRNGVKAAAILTAKQKAIIRKQLTVPTANGDILDAILKTFHVDEKKKEK